MQRYLPRLMIQAGPKGHAPLFCIPGSGDNITVFSDLAEAVGSNLPIYGFQPRGLDRDEAPFPSVESAAECYLESLQEMRLPGPVHLLGHSFGGWVAFQMARRLWGTRNQVAMLFLLDSEAPHTKEIEWGGSASVHVLLSLIEIYELKLGRSLGLSRPLLEAMDERSQVKDVFTKLIGAALLPKRMSLQTFEGIVGVFKVDMASTFAPEGAYAGSCRMFAPSSSVSEAENQQTEMRLVSWRHYLPDLLVQRVSGNHVTMLRNPHVEAIAGHLRYLPRRVERVRVGRLAP